MIEEVAVASALAEEIGCIIDFACTHTCETGIAESSICEGETLTVKCTEEGSL